MYKCFYYIYDIKLCLYLLIMNDKFSFLYNNVPFITNSYFSSDIYEKNDLINNQILNLDENIFIINFKKPTDISDTSSLKFNDPNYMLFNVLKNGIDYNLPSINYYNDFSYVVKKKLWNINSLIKKLLKDLGYENIITPHDFFNEKNEDTLFYQELQINDINQKNKLDCIFIFFYSDEQNNLDIQKSFYSNKIWNTIKYPYYDYELIISFVYKKNNSIKYLDKTKNNIDVHFDNFEYINFLNKIGFHYYLKENKSNLNNTKIYLKSLISNSEFINKNETVIINLNEISIKQNKNINNGLFEKINKHRTNKFETFSNTSNYFSLTSDDKLSYINTKIFNINKKYSVYKNYSNDRKIITQYYINNTIPIQEPSLNLVNKNIKKILITINNNVIDPYFIYNLEIYNIFQHNNEIMIDSNYNLIFTNDIIQTNTYYTNIYRIVFKYEDKIYYIILNLCFYNEKYLFTYKNETFLNYCYLMENFCLEPTFYNLSSQYQIYENVNNISSYISKYYYYYLNYDDISSIKTDYNKRMINHFYMNIPNVIVNLKYDNSNINNIIYILPILINDLIYEIVSIHINYPKLKNNIYQLPSTLVISIVLDNNISMDYIDIITINNELYKQIHLTENIDDNKNKIIELLNLNQNYLSSSFSLLIKINENFMIQSFETEIFIKIVNDDMTEEFIKLFNYKNGESGLYEGYVIKPRLMKTDYYNFFTMNIYFDVFDKLPENNIMLFNKDEFLLKLHNEIYSNELIIYDNMRLKHNLTLNLENVNVNNKYEEYLELYLEELKNKYIIFIINCFDISNMIKEIELLIFELLNTNETIEKENIIFIIHQLIFYCIDLSNTNRELYLTYSETPTIFNNLFIEIQNINLNTSNEKLIELKSSCVYIETYFNKKINFIKNEKNINNVLVENINSYNGQLKHLNDILNNIHLQLTFNDEKINEINNVIKLLFQKYIVHKFLEETIKLYNILVPLNNYDFDVVYINDLINEIETNNHYKKLFKLIISLLKLTKIQNDKENELNDKVKNNILLEDNFDKISSYEEYLNKIYLLKNMKIENLNNNVNFINIPFYEIQINENINNLEIKKNIEINNNEKLLLNYNYVNTSYKYLK